MLRIYKIGIYVTVFTVNVLTRICKIKRNRITFISYRTNDLEDNFKFIASALEKQGTYENIFLLKRYDSSFSGKWGYFLNIIKQAYYFNTSKVILLDGNSVVMKAIIKKKKVAVIQVWHACGALKKFGEDTKDRLYKIKSCDFAITSGRAVTEIYSRVLNVPVDRVLGLGLPRTDVLFIEDKIETARKKIFDKYSIEHDKKLILYAPTFRGKGIDDIYALDFDFEGLREGMPNNYIIAMRFHPLISYYHKPKYVIDLTNEALEDVLCATDILITDYSSVVFEYSILERPMIFYCPDLDEYKHSRGFYVDFESFIPGKIASDSNQLYALINELTVKNGSKDPKTRQIKETYFDYRDGKSTDRILKLIEMLICDEQVDQLADF